MRLFSLLLALLFISTTYALECIEYAELYYGDPHMAHSVPLIDKAPIEREQRIKTCSANEYCTIYVHIIYKKSDKYVLFWGDCRAADVISSNMKDPWIRLKLQEPIGDTGYEHTIFYFSCKENRCAKPEDTQQVKVIINDALEELKRATHPPAVPLISCHVFRKQGKDLSRKDEPIKCNLCQLFVQTVESKKSKKEIRAVCAPPSEKIGCLVDGNVFTCTCNTDLCITPEFGQEVYDAFDQKGKDIDVDYFEGKLRISSGGGNNSPEGQDSSKPETGPQGGPPGGAYPEQMAYDHGSTVFSTSSFLFVAVLAIFFQ